MINNKLNLTVIIVTMLVIAGVFGLFFVYNYSKDKTTIESTGVYTKNVQPDEVLVYLNIEARSKVAEDAKNENARISKNVLFSLGSFVNSSSIETENYNIYPDYKWTDGSQEIVGYVATNNIKIKTSDFNKIGKIIDAAVDNGALVSYINFELSTEKNNQEESETLTKATEDAKSKAESIAKGLGKEIGKVVSISSSDYNYNPYPLYRVMEGSNAKDVATNIQPKSLEVFSTVKVVYELE